MRDKRICQVLVGTAEPWLDEVYGASILDLFESLSKLGHSVRILVPSYRSAIVRKGRLHIKAVRMKRQIPLVSKLCMWTRFLQLALRQRTRSAIVVDSYLFPAVFLARLLRKARVVMLILSRPVPAVGEETVGKTHALYFRLSLILARYLADAITSITPMEAEEFRRLANIPREKVFVVSSPISEAFFEYKRPSDANVIRRKLGMNLLIDKKVVLYHGEMEEYRAVTEVAREFTKAFTDRNDIVLLFVGAGSARRPLEMRVRRNELRNCAVMGPVPYSAMPGLIKSCDLGLVILPDRPWWRNQCPTKLLEFLVMNKPVVATDLPGIRWAARDSPLVTYVKGFKAEELRTAITKALAIPGAARNLDSERLQMFASGRLAGKLDSIIRGQALV